MSDALERAHRESWGPVLAAALRVVRDVDLAEDCAQEAFTAAVSAWAREGVPASPAGWLTTVARRRGVDLVRREATLRSKLPLLVVPGEDVLQGPEVPDRGAGSWEELGADVDDQLRLVFLCCHPALAPEAQAALTLRLVCGVSTADVAAAFLVPETTMAARITRAKRKVAVARIPLAVPGPAQLPSRLDGVLAVVHLLFTTGHAAPSGPALVRPDLVERSLHLARQLQRLLPGEPEVSGLVALLLLTDARRGTRTDGDGALVVLARQDRTAWDHAEVGRARRVLAGVVRSPRAGRFVLQAMLALAHAEAPSSEETDWPVVLGLYDQLLERWPSPVVALNRAVAVAHVHGPQAALAEVEALDDAGRLSGYRYLPAVRADLLARLGRHAEARVAYEGALALAGNDVERRHLQARLEA